MIHFISNTNHQAVQNEEILIPSIEDGIKELWSFVENNERIGKDYETTGLDPITNDLLLLILGNAKVQFVIDITQKNSDLWVECQKILQYCYDNNKVMIGHNIKFDISCTCIKFGIMFRRVYDTMICEQRLKQGYEGIFGLDDIMLRRFKRLPDGMNSKVTQEFIGVNPKFFVIRNHHIKYAAADVESLFYILDEQIVETKQNRLEFLIYKIEFPLIHIVATAELEGFKLNEKKWLENVEKNKRIRDEKLIELDNEFRRLRDDSNSIDKRYIKDGKYDRVRRNKESVIQIDLFGEEIAEEKNKDNTYINWSSTDQVVYIVGSLGEKVPDKKGFPVLPTFTIINGKRKVDKSYGGFTTQEDAIESLLVEEPNIRTRKLWETLIEYRTSCNRINTFGKSFIDKYTNKVTKKVHTIFRQCFAVNGRFQSGGGKKQPDKFNSQNIPKDKEYRECFGTDDGYSISTTDLGGAEVIIMSSKAQQLNLYKMAIIDEDVHSPIAQKAWRNIYSSRYNRSVEIDVRESLFLKSTNLVISKTENKDLRDVFKNVTFAAVYGARDKKVAKMLNIIVNESRIVISTIKSFFPKVFKYVEGCSTIATTRGCLLINERTNSRIWYPPVIGARELKTDISFHDYMDISGNARNVTISGTQADMIKEAIVEIQQGIYLQNIDATFLGQVHDELIYKQAKNCDGISKEWKVNPKYVKFYDEVSKDTKEVSFPDFVKKTMIQVANRYLINVKMGADQHVKDTWTK